MDSSAVYAVYIMSSLKAGIEKFEIAEKHFNAFADAFLTPAVARRWRVLFGGATAAKWRKINPWWVWDENRRSSGAQFQEIVVSVSQIAANMNIGLDPSKDAVVISVGHSEPAVLVKPFWQLSTSDWPLDGLVSLDAGHFAFVFNHDGEVILCRT